MKEIINTDRYITQETLLQCFELGQFNYVDKVICGNGFSTAFINSKPPRGMFNIIIAPNRAVVTSKENQYRANPTGNVIKFFYKDSIDLDFEGADVLMFVADSFLLMKDRFLFNRDKINFVLIDEAHSVEIQSLFRRKLVNFIPKVRKIIGSEPALTCVTATPNHFTDVTIRIKNSYIPENKIVLTNDFEKAVNKIRGLRDAGENVLVCTNNKNVIYRLKDGVELEADYIIGEGLSRSLSELIVIKQNPDSNLKIVSSRGFEGFDILGKDFSVFFFEDRGSASGFETFFISNLYQAMNRVREGAKYVEYCRKELVNKRKDHFNDIDADVDNFINRTDLSVYQKQSVGYAKGYYIFHPFIKFDQDKNPDSSTYGNFSIVRNEASIRLYKESFLYDNPFPSAEFQSFLDERKITIEKKIGTPNKLKNIKLRDADKEDRLELNTAFIDNLDLFGEGYILVPKNRETLNDFVRDLKTHIRRKDYNKLRGMTPREEIGLDLLTDLKKFDKLVSEVTKAYDTRSIEKYGVRPSKKYRDEFRTKSVSVVAKMVLIFCNEKISIPSKWVANRDYNILTDIGIPEIEIIAGRFNIETTEIDVNSAFIRIVYAINMVDLPEDFYGKNKENKLAINIFLNDFFYNPSKATPKKIQKIRAIEKFKKLGFNDKVIIYLIDNFFESQSRGNLFHFLTFYEKQLVSNLKKMAIEDFQTEGVGRRHDSLILFNNESNLERLNHLEFLGREGWFKIATPEKVMNREEEINEFREWYDREIKGRKEVTKNAV